MANSADYKAAAQRLSALPNGGGMAGAATRMLANATAAPVGSRFITMMKSMRQTPASWLAANAGQPQPQVQQAMKKGGKVKKMAKGGSTASKRADGCATKGKTKGRLI